jgi:hypothetical protein
VVGSSPKNDVTLETWHVTEQDDAARVLSLLKKSRQSLDPMHLNIGKRIDMDAAWMNKTLKGNCGNKAKGYVDFDTAEISRLSARR